jgi:hypothetical protein
MIIARRRKKVMINERYMISLLQIRRRNAGITIRAKNRRITYRYYGISYMDESIRRIIYAVTKGTLF